MKSMKRLSAIGLCILLFIGAIPVMGMAGYTDPDSLFGDLFDLVSATTTLNSKVVSEGGSYYLYIDGHKVTQTGLYYDGSEYYYVFTDSTLASDEKVFVTDSTSLEDAYYYFETDCKMRKYGMLDLEDGTLHYENGKLSHGLTKIDDDYYFFELNRGYMLKNEDIFIDSDNKYGVMPGVYTFDSEGKMTVTPEYMPDLGKDATATGVAVRSCFSDNMILQRDQKISVWGKADVNSGTVIVEFAGKTARATVDSTGTWKATFDETFPYSTEKRELIIHGGDGDTVLKDILVGDVYFVIGQSNVHYSLQEQTSEMISRGMDVYWDYSDSRNIRFYRNSALYTADLTGPYAQGNALEFTEIMVSYPWMTPSEVENHVDSAVQQNSNHRAFSALGYLFAYELSDRTDVPVGVIEIDAAGMPLTAFAPNSLAAKWGDEEFNSQTGVYTYNLRGQVPAPDMLSRFVYNQLINPLKNFSTAGIVWYQGESDALNHRGAAWGDDGKTYAYQFAELMEFYRDNIGGGQYDFPVYVIELPTNYYNNGQNIYIDYGPLRSEQGRIPDLLSDSHLVSSADFFTDITYTNTLHPYIKDKQAQRLAKIVAADKYGAGTTSNEEGPRIIDTEYTSPTSVTFTYTNVGSGLKQNYGSYVLGFEVWTGDYDANGNKVWYFVTDARITANNKVTISFSKEILAVRYHASTEASYPGFGEAYPTLSLNLTNSNGIPASAYVDIKE